MIVLGAGGTAVGVLLVVATVAQLLAGVLTRSRKEDAGMKSILHVVGSSMMVTVSSVFTNIATVGSHPLTQTS